VARKSAIIVVDGDIQVPRELLKLAGIRDGCRVIVEVVPGGLLIKPLGRCTE